MEKDIIGKEVKLIWQDKDRVLVKIGVIKDISPEFITIKTEKRLEMIPTQRVLRIELKGGNGK